VVTGNDGYHAQHDPDEQHGEVTRGAVIAAVAAQHPGRPAGAVLADIMDMVHAQDTQDGLAKLTVIVWSEALRNRSC
jgi:hypothetical protein